MSNDNPYRTTYASADGARGLTIISDRPLDEIAAKWWTAAELQVIPWVRVGDATVSLLNGSCETPRTHHFDRPAIAADAGSYMILYQQFLGRCNTAKDFQILFFASLQNASLVQCSGTSLFGGSEADGHFQRISDVVSAPRPAAAQFEPGHGAAGGTLKIA